MAEEGPQGASSLVSLPFLLLAPRWGARFFPTAARCRLQRGAVPTEPCISGPPPASAPGSVANEPCDLGQVALPLWPLVSSACRV